MAQGSAHTDATPWDRLTGGPRRQLQLLTCTAHHQGDLRPTKPFLGEIGGNTEIIHKVTRVNYMQNMRPSTGAGAATADKSGTSPLSYLDTDAPK